MGNLSDSQTNRPASAPGRLNSALGWLLAMGLAVLATILVMDRDEPKWVAQALAQRQATGAGPGLGARGIYAFPGQLGPRDYGVFMIDVDSGTLWCYQLERGRTGQRYLQLVAARNWLADRYLEEFNVGSPTPSEVRHLVEQQRQPSTPTPAPQPRETETQPATQPPSLELPDFP
jgi:hypothetical protein